MNRKSLLVIVCLFFVHQIVCAQTSTGTKPQPDQAILNTRISIDVTEVTPGEAFGALARSLNC